MFKKLKQKKESKLTQVRKIEEFLTDEELIKYYNNEKITISNTRLARRAVRAWDYPNYDRVKVILSDGKYIMFTLKFIDTGSAVDNVNSVEIVYNDKVMLSSIREIDKFLSEETILNKKNMEL